MRSRPHNRFNTCHDPLRGERGASLVEILVVMVVLLVGIFTIVRIFPRGFDILQYSANETVAHRLADAEVEFWRKNAANLPEGIVAVSPGPPGYSQFDPTVRPGDFTSGTGAYGDDTTLREDVRARLGNNATEDQIDRWVGQNRQRRILGEITRIPAPSPLSQNSGGERYASVYSLAYAPIDWPATNPTDQDGADQYLQIRGNPLAVVDLTGLTGDTLKSALLNLSDREAGINYRTAVLYFKPVDRPRFFLASYTYRTPAGLKTVRSDRLTVTPPPANPRGGTDPASTVMLGIVNRASANYDSNYDTSRDSVETGTLDLAPKFRYLPQNQTFSNVPNDPYSVYEYKVLSNSPLGNQFMAAIAFNPRGYNRLEGGPTGLDVPIQARIDYLVRDWRILRQDVTLPGGNAPYRARLALTYIKQAGQTVSDEELTPWPGLGTVTPPLSVLAVDTSDGSFARNSMDTEGSDGGFVVDYRTGLLEFPRNLKVIRADGSPDPARDPAGRTFRIFYSVEGDWSVVPQKAYNEYDLIDFKTAQATPNFTLPIGTATIAPDLQDGQVQVLFPTTDEGKAVSYDYAYRTKNGNLKTVNGEEQQISSEARMTGGKTWYYPLGGNGSAMFKPYIFIKLPGDADVRDVGRDFTLKQLRGVSFRAVTVWKDRSRWRQAAVTTHLTRSNS